MLRADIVLGSRNTVEYKIDKFLFLCILDSNEDDSNKNKQIKNNSRWW